MALRVSAVLLVLLLLVVSPAVAVTASHSDTGLVAQTTPTQQPVSESTTLRLQLQQNGDAVWRISDTYALEDANDTAAFESLAQSYVDGDTDIGWEQSFRDASRGASAATGREMTITNVSRDYSVDGDSGELVLQFTWTNFATTNESRLLVGDAFNTTQGTWLPQLYEDQTLIISPPRGYAVTSAPPTDINDGSLRFEGPQTFEPGDLEIVYQGGGVTPGGFPLWLVAGIVLVLGLATAVAYLNSADALPSVSGREPDERHGAPAAPAEDGSDDEVDIELLSDEERVERLLDGNGGRMKQARIVNETGWSNAKVSQLLSSMDEEGRIDKLRIGRENLISFPDEDVTEIED